MEAMLKKVGSSGQITLGKKFAGRTVIVESTEPGVGALNWVLSCQIVNGGS